MNTYLVTVVTGGTTYRLTVVSTSADEARATVLRNAPSAKVLDVEEQ